jgi:Fe-S-cluster containining protein
VPPPTDADLLAAVDGALEQALRHAGRRLDFSRGCPACCIGPFPINALDAQRLRRGLASLEVTDPARARAVRERAERAVAIMRSRFPGDVPTGVLAGDDAAEERFCAEHEHLPCPALDPASGRCDLYASRPLSCRTYGPPVRLGGRDLPPCGRCFSGDPRDAEECRVEPDPDGLEERLLSRLQPSAADAETYVAFALVRTPR